MKKHNFKQETINNATMYLTHIRAHLIDNNNKIDTKRRKEIADYYKMPYSALSYSLELGYFTRLDISVYKPNYTKFDPIHGRSLLTKIHERRSENYHNKKSKPNQPNTQLIKECKNPKQTLKNKKTFSLFWGLFKFNY